MSAKHYDRAAAVKAIDEAGVKGLDDAGVAKIPPCFIQPPEQSQPGPTRQILVIDLTSVGTSWAQRERAVAQVLHAAATFSFFQVLNHGIPNEVLDDMLRAVARFHEEPVEVKRPFYMGDPRRKVRSQSNFDLYTARVTNWKDTLQCNMAPEAPHPEELPAA